MKNTLTVKTPHGTFTRTTTSKYTHVVVRSSARAQEAAKRNEKYGVEARWAKDGGYAVTWHSSAQAAAKAANTVYTWDLKTTVLGIYAVGSEETPKAPKGMDLSTAVVTVAHILEMPYDQAERLLNNVAGKPLSDYTSLVKILTT
jgi:hypothetical protein